MEDASSSSFPPSLAGPSLHSAGGSSGGQDGSGGKHGGKRGPRTRTKTGCLTCRKRRVKCDEGRPVCAKCIKAKRECEGYNQKVTFKNPYNKFPTAASGPTIFPPDSALAGTEAGSSAQSALQAIAPKPAPPGFFQYPGQQDDIQEDPQTLDYKGKQRAQTGYQISQSPFPGDSRSDQNQNPFERPGQGSYAARNPPSLSFSALLNPLQGLDVQTQGYSQQEYSESPYQLHAPTFGANVGNQEGGMSGQRSMHTRSGLRSVTVDVEDDSMVEPISPLFWSLAGPDLREDAWHSSESPIKELMGSEFQRVLSNFIERTGPSLSMYERLPFASWTQDQLTPSSPHLAPNLWTHTFPTAAFTNMPLMRAILALSSFQLASLQDPMGNNALRIYQTATRGHRRIVAQPEKINDPAQLATSLLLAYFHVWKSDHMTWSGHVKAASMFIPLIGLREMTQRCLAAKVMRQKQRESELRALGAPFSSWSSNFTTKLNFDLLSSLTGQNVQPEDYNLGRQSLPFDYVLHMKEEEVKKYENFRDLFWWYCKMDVYQSMLGACKLFLNYHRWTDCLPRAPINVPRAIYGTYDHLLLVLGRLAAFAAKDRRRKRQATQPASGPSFLGMIPATEDPPLPRGFVFPTLTPQQGEAMFSEDDDQEMSYQDALMEWDSLRRAFATFIAQLGPDFQPMTAEDPFLLETPFGQPLHFRSPQIAGIWMNYYMGLIHLHRCHPDMPAAAMTAAGMATRHTHHLALQIGRIAATVVPDTRVIQSGDQLLNAFLLESCFTLFWAAIEYREDAQRYWVVKRMYDISQITGWQSARHIASGCESAWIKAAQASRGPVYFPLERVDRPPESVWQNPRRIDEAIVEQSRSNNELVVKSTDRSHYAMGLLETEEDMSKLRIVEDNDD